ncbi:MAG: hypothetical protein MJY84_06465 [Bacteroidales bacterium]|nr:hypothetical protein [Bacteroidales bacterium]
MATLEEELLLEVEAAELLLEVEADELLLEVEEEAAELLLEDCPLVPYEGDEDLEAVEEEERDEVLVLLELLEAVDEFLV